MLKKTLLTLVVVTALSAGANAALLAHWGFDTYDGSQNPVLPEDGDQSGTATLTTATPGATLSGPVGTTLNDPRGTPSASQALEYTGNATAINGSTFVIHFSGTGLSTFVVTYAAFADSSGASINTWAYSTDGTTFTDLGGTLSVGTAYSVLTADFSAVTALDGAANVYLRNTLSGGTGNNKNSDFDNIQVSSVPEPINVALVLFGLTFCGVTFGRRLIGFARA